MQGRSAGSGQAARPRRAIRTALGAAVLAAVLLASLGARAASLENFAVRGMKIGGEFTLTDHFGKKRALSGFKGKVVVLFFGYTHCPDICPAALAHVAKALKSLRGKSGAVRALFITVDPERDTAAHLKTYLGSFGDRFLGLTGSRAEIAAVARPFRAGFKKGKGKTAAGYPMVHSSFLYLLNGEGRVRYMMPHTAGAAAVLAGINALLP